MSRLGFGKQGKTMSGRIAAKIKELGIDLPKAPAPVANYVPWGKSGSLLFISGQITMGANGFEYMGTVGGEISVDDGKRAAGLAAINVVAQAAAALNGDLDRVVRVVKVTGLVNSANGFSDQPAVINGASDLFVD